MSDKLKPVDLIATMAYDFFAWMSSRALKFRETMQGVKRGR